MTRNVYRVIGPPPRRCTISCRGRESQSRPRDLLSNPQLNLVRRRTRIGGHMLWHLVALACVDNETVGARWALSKPVVFLLLTRLIFRRLIADEPAMLPSAAGREPVASAGRLALRAAAPSAQRSSSTPHGGDSLAQGVDPPDSRAPVGRM